MNNELYHHGVKGQKWGDKNGPPYPLAPEDHSSREKKEKWQYSLNRNTNDRSKFKKIADYSAAAGKLSFKGGKKSGNKNKASSKTTGPLKERIESPVKKAGIMASNGVHASDINMRKLMTLRPMNDKGITIAKGQMVQHVMCTPTKDMTNRDYLFVAATEADKKNYGGYFAALTKYRNNVDQMYKMEMTAMNDLVSPSKKERVKTFIEIYKEDPIRVGTQLAEFNKRNYGDQFKETTEQLAKKYSNMSMRELKKMGYYTYANSWFDPEAGTLKDMRGKLEAKGYNAIIDDNDKRSFVQSQAPLIVFDVMNNLGNTKVSKLSNGEIRRNMIDWQNMKHSDGGEFMDLEIDALYHHGIKGQKWGVRRYQNQDGSLTAAGKQKYMSPETKEKIAHYAKVGAVAAVGVLAAYGTHKLINDPRAIEVGKTAISKMRNANTSILSKTTSSIKSSTEYKLAKAAIDLSKPGLSKIKKGLQIIGDDKTTKTLAGIGTMAFTASMLKQQYGELKELKGKDMNKFDKGSQYIQKFSDIAANASTLAKGPARQPAKQNGSNNKQNDDKTSSSPDKDATKFFKDFLGEEPKGNGTYDEKEYASLFNGDVSSEVRADIKKMRKLGYTTDQMRSYISGQEMLRKLQN